MASGDTKTEAMLNVLGNGGSGDEFRGCCNTKTQSYILDAIDRINNLDPGGGGSDFTVLTDDNANWTNPDTGDEYIASWLLEKGIYALAEDATISIASYVENEGGETTVANEYSSSENPVLWTSGYNSDDPTSYADITTIANVSSCYYTVNGNGEVDELSWFIPSVFIGTNGSADGTAGLVPAPATTDVGKFLKADGTWDTAGSAINVVQTNGTSTTDVMSQKAVTDALSALEARVAALEGN